MQPKFLITSAAIFGAGIGFKGFFILDEVVLMIVSTLYVIRRPRSVLRIKKTFGPLSIILLILMFYTAWQPPSVNVSFLQFLRHFYIFVFIFAFLIYSKYNYFDPVNVTDNLKFINNIFLLYFICTIIQGVIAERIVGYYTYAGAAGVEITGVQGRYFTQGIWWVGSAYFSIVALVNLLLLVKTPINPLPNIILMLITAIYFGSRTLLILISAFLPLIIFSDYQNKRKIKTLAIILVGSLFGAVVYHENLLLIFESLVDVLLLEPRDSDMDRLDHILASIELIISNPVTFFFGNGWQSHKYLLSQALNNGIAVVRTTGAAALINDTGMLGILVFSFLLTNLAYKIMQAYGPVIGFYLSVIVTFFTCGIMYITYPLDSILYILFLFGYFIPSKFIIKDFNSKPGNEECLKS